MERSETATAATSMIAVTNKESPTVVSPYSQTKSLQSVKSVLTTNSLSPEQSSMPSVTQVPNYPSGSSSPESGVSTPVSDKTSRIRSPQRSRNEAEKLHLRAFDLSWKHHTNNLDQLPASIFFVPNFSFKSKSSAISHSHGAFSVGGIWGLAQPTSTMSRYVISTQSTTYK
ncbi:hypothetical protein V8E51_015243 [Hyaloscypha variabilis]